MSLPASPQSEAARRPSPLARSVLAPEWLARWAVAGVLLAIDVIWLSARHDGSELLTLAGAGGVIVLLVTAFALALLSFASNRLARPLLVASDFMDSMVYVFAFGAALAPFMSLMASLDRPLIDAALERADRLLGFDWLQASEWVGRHVLLARGLTAVYWSFLWQAPIILLLGSHINPGERNTELIWLYIVSVLACVMLSGALPALGMPGVIGMKHIEELRAIRSGHWTLASVNSGGIVTFPSFHAVLAVIYIYCARHRLWALSVLMPVNLMMLASTPTVGGHYLVDVIAGIAVAFASIAVVRALRRRSRPGYGLGKVSDGNHIGVRRI
jgi:membrane-associated phospholipid phosphatase